jgi:hypothetical protein
MARSGIAAPDTLDCAMAAGSTLHLFLQSIRTVRHASC